MKGRNQLHTRLCFADASACSYYIQNWGSALSGLD